ncbi:hypothetical protein K4K49_010154 [Colletotrichum sp. SAR 10_70]|nr:hypothetical protein KHU50_006188 [Colletotrichum sp. SAR 10_65]KAI8170357.1 hypothetical protein K4K50_008108 [Colletotrichum sp. SAR 10_71]KAI8182473.1 hypothetical protein K4K51_000983 [Colletotrichum sp. SAR 10_75]KAI8194085.1 hypothetical protein K4K49_010154 [Colletotrichum sp. SAR 10_70]KAI8225480.1 hypothetical protein K4K53_006392 [Colletotrichum sp. SAR 10_77]KAJ5001092.1 hypothetical protein K4K48_001879 [Colletotrichum sp. SAR 10_66]
MLFLAVLLFTTVPLVSSQFLNPSQSRELWRIGQTRKVQYNTKLEKYTIALWQQAIAGGSATLGPIIVETATGPKREFEWKVDLEELDLGASNVFFFWLFEGDNFLQHHRRARTEQFILHQIFDNPNFDFSRFLVHIVHHFASLIDDRK